MLSDKLRIHPVFIYPTLILLIIFFLFLAAFLVPNDTDSISVELLLNQQQQDNLNESGISFKKEEDEWDYLLSYQWKNFKDQSNVLFFKISKADLKAAEDEFGYFRKHAEFRPSQIH